MKTLTILKHTINFIFLAFIVSSCIGMLIPFIGESSVIGSVYYSQQEIFWTLIVFPFSHLIIIFMILFNLRKFVLNAHIGTPLDNSTSKYLRQAGIYFIIYGLFRIYEVSGLISFYRVTGEYDLNIITDNFLNFGSLFYSFLLGLFFIYLSKVLELSDKIRQENKLTI